MIEQRDLSERLLEYGAQVIKFVESLPPTEVALRRSWSPTRRATSVGANYEEAQGAESKSDFVHKLQIALKEMRESHYWLRLLAKAETVSLDRLAPLIEEATQLRAMLSKAVATTKGKAK
jgi:four helix bundle protein